MDPDVNNDDEADVVVVVVVDVGLVGNPKRDFVSVGAAVVDGTDGVDPKENDDPGFVDVVVDGLEPNENAGGAAAAVDGAVGAVKLEPKLKPVEAGVAIEGVGVAPKLNGVDDGLDAGGLEPKENAAGAAVPAVVVVVEPNENGDAVVDVGTAEVPNGDEKNDIVLFEQRFISN